VTSTGGWTLSAVDGSAPQAGPVSSWTAGKTYTVTLSGNGGLAKGFVAAPFRSAAPTTFSGTKAGSFSSVNGNVRKMSCAGGVTQTSAVTVGSYTFSWAAPTTSGIGSVTLWAGGITTSYSGVAYNNVKLTLTEALAVTPSGTPSNSPTPSITPSPSSTGTPSPSVTPTPSQTPTVSGSGTGTGTPSATLTPSPTPSASASSSESPWPAGVSRSPSSTPVSPSGTPSHTPTPSVTPSRSPSGTVTASPTPSQTPSSSRTATRTPTPSRSASQTPTATPSVTPTPFTPCAQGDVCGAHGVCTTVPARLREDVSFTCACDEEGGYVGDFCDSCAPTHKIVYDASRDGSFTCVLNTAGASAMLRWDGLDADAGVIGASGSQQRHDHEVELAAGIAGGLGLDNRRVNVTIADLSLGEGGRGRPRRRALTAVLVPVSLVVAILPTNDPMSPSSPAAASALRALVANASGPLAAAFVAAGVVLPATAAANGTLAFAPALPLPPLCATGLPCAYPAALALTDRLAVAWSVDAAAGVVHIQLAFTSASAEDVTWFAIAFNDGPGMVGGDSITVEPGRKSVGRYLMQGYTLDTCPALDGDGTFLPAYSSYVEYEGGGLGGRSEELAASPIGKVLLQMEGGGGGGGAARRTIVATCARRLVDAGPGGVLGSRTVVAEEDTYMTFAWGPKGIDTISSHTAATSGAVEVNLRDGSLARGRMPLWALAAHGAAALLGLVVLLPFSALVAVVGRRIPDEVGRKFVGVVWGVGEKDGGAAVVVGVGGGNAAQKFVPVVIGGGPRGGGLGGPPGGGGSGGPYAWWKRAHTQLLWWGTGLAAASTLIGVVATPASLRGATLHAYIGYAVCGAALLVALGSRGTRRSAAFGGKGDVVWRVAHAGVGACAVLATPYAVWTGAEDARVGLAPIAVVLAVLLVGLGVGAVRVLGRGEGGEEGKGGGQPQGAAVRLSLRQVRTPAGEAAARPPPLGRARNGVLADVRRGEGRRAVGEAFEEAQREGEREREEERERVGEIERLTRALAEAEARERLEEEMRREEEVRRRRRMERLIMERLGEEGAGGKGGR
jgi:hypothetical protein